MFASSNRQKLEDQQVTANITDGNLMNKLFIRLGAKDKTFKKVDFRYSIFDTCYLRGCTFDSCDFTGCRFLATSLYGSQFTGCKFDYAIFERTIVDTDILDSSCPGTENLKMRFARTLRKNFQQLGDAQAENKAIKIELQASEIHLHKAWESNEAYYRKKYQGWKRFTAWVEWLKFKILDLIWGNGESPLKLLRSVLIVLIIISVIDIICFLDRQQLASYIQALVRSPQIFLGMLTPKDYPGLYLALIFVSRLIAIGFFISMVIKRFNRR